MVIYGTVINEQLPQVITFKGTVSFRHVISEGKSHFILSEVIQHLDGAIDFRPQAGAGKPGGGVGGTENVPFLSAPQPPCRMAHTIRRGPTERRVL